MSGVSRMMAMATWLVGSVIAFVVVALYSFLHMLERMAGITADQSHLFLGIGLTILAVIPHSSWSAHPRSEQCC